ncbi:helicase-like protein [Sphingomonas sp. PP-F2F-A104-K0414]|uniref:DEAD/DEAH box helicase n=1 Tax=Sphingomonas sp. PP-F2F-A104-K0414 TaxID=2135661 RepID=UPI0010EEEC2F|nr:DEAD/DEAH box helicase [Sphingomonas sp. PP-F2F-A104-K0414]TCP99546.1 helicase-like protein [Sphingomonas sp. PP-F2F-A104-K0414]
MNEASAPSGMSYDEIALNPPSGVEISSRVLAPALVISRRSDRFVARLGARRVIRGAERILSASDVTSNWVVDGAMIFPLPKDISSIAAEALTGCDPENLTFPDILRLERNAAETLPVIRNIDNLRTANEEAGADAENASGDVPGLNATLYPYQAGGVAWMHRMLDHTGGVILADEMGLGKTIQIIALFLLSPPDPLSPALIVCPTTLIENWVRELQGFAPSLSVMVHRGPDRTGFHKDLQKKQIVITTYDTLVNDNVIFAGLEWSFVVCDEAQAIKNPTAKRRLAVARLPRRRTIPVTGTPVENGLLDLWSLVDIAIPGLLGEQTYFETRWPDDIDAARSLATVTDPFILKRQVSEVAKDLPERIDIDVPLELGEELAKQYDQVRSDTMTRYPIAGALVATGQLALFCAHPWLRAESTTTPDWEDHVIIAEGSGTPLVTPKMERLLAILGEAFARRKKVLIFANFNQCGPLIRQAAAGLSKAFWGAINGSTPQADRQATVDRFSEHDGPAVLILNPRAAGAGLNITAATIVIHFTQVWNPALEKQASARAHRRGQTEPVTIYRLFYVNTVEEVMLDRTHWKSELGNEAVPVSVRDGTDLQRALSVSPVQS